MSKFKNLFICITPLQIVIAKRIIEEKQLNTHLFISYDEIQQVLEDPLNVGTILNKEQFVSVLYRASTSLSFVSLDDILQIETLFLPVNTC